MGILWAFAVREGRMLRRKVNGYEMAYIEVGQGRPLVAVHGTLGDFRVWGPVLGPLSQRHRVIAVSLRHFFPEHWDGVGSDHTIVQHTADVIGFIEGLGAGPVDLMGHSRGGHIAFRAARQRPDLLRRLVLAEPGGNLDASLAPPGAPPAPSFAARYVAAAERVGSGDIDAGLVLFAEIVGTPWADVPSTARQTWRDNARTLLGQINERRQPFTRGDAEAIRVPTLLVGGAETKGTLPGVLRALAASVPDARVEMIPGATHFMFEQDPARFCAAVTKFLAQ
jgi:pimeloyl-ACP methyl ester carboxylesterase